jgi:1-acyl-sn-glycerol-3-phosphate acyltransferase
LTISGAEAAGSSRSDRSLTIQRIVSAACMPLALGACRWLARRGRHRIEGIDELREKVWGWLDRHDGPVIWTANHLTQLDSVLATGQLFSWGRAYRESRYPWCLPRTSLFWPEGTGWRERLLKSAIYLVRGLPIVREGDDAEAAASRERVFRDCVSVLRGGGSVFVFPEADLSPNGWLDRNRPKDFIGRLSTEVPKAAVLCLYMRGESQTRSSLLPEDGERFRMLADWLAPDWDADTPPREVSQRVFDRLAALQDGWFAGSTLVRNCGGNDVIDLESPGIRDRFDSGDGCEEWLERHLTPRERASLGDPCRDPEARRRFWRHFAAKEAAYKALAQAGIDTPHQGYGLLEADLFTGRVVHLPTGASVEIRFTDDDADKIHCVAVFRGGRLGEDGEPGDALWRVDRLPEGEDPSSYVRDRLVEFVAESSDDLSAEELAVTSVGGVPKLLRRGEIQDWGVSISHSGRFVACSFIAS